jgi:hypothetical protein
MKRFGLEQQRFEIRHASDCARGSVCPRAQDSAGARRDGSFTSSNKALRQLPADALPGTNEASVMINTRLRIAMTAFACLTASQASARCLIIGDSIAVGLAGQFSKCASRANVGLSSGAVMRLAASAPLADWAAISAGSDDPTNPALRGNLEAIRERVRARRVIWIVPRNGRAAAVVRAVAGAHGDGAVAFSTGRDGVHPLSYPTLAKSVAAS